MRTWKSKFLSHFSRDYKAKAELDRYENDGIDDDDHDELDYGQRRLIDRELDQEEKARARNKSRMPGAFFDADEYSEDELGRQMRMERMRAQRYEQNNDGD